MIAWMLYSALVALVVAASARAAEWLARLGSRGVRWVWLGGLALTMALSVSALWRGSSSKATTAAASSGIDIGDLARGRHDASWRQVLDERIDKLRRSLDAPLFGAAVAMRRTISPKTNVYVVSLSSAISFGLIVVLIGVTSRFRRARRAWPLATVQGVGVRVAPRVGPVVIGFMRPEIVVPRWLLARRADEQQLVVAHESEHVRARDPLLLGLGWISVIIMPWNPAVWYMLSRLRLSIELDCDARVLRRGAAPRSYGSLLIDVAQNASSLRLSALALADDSSHLRQRILAMKPTIPRFAHVRGSIAAAFALAGLLVACQATLPTDAEVDQMDVASATRSARALAKAEHADTAVTYTVDGRTVTSAEATALSAKEVSAVQIVTGQPGELTRINIDTRKPDGVVSSTSPQRRKRAEPGLEAVGTLFDTAQSAAPMATKSKTSFTGLIFIDGVRSTDAEMRALDPKQIESVEVLKGVAAQQLYGPGAVNGVITVKTKRAK